ncbi:MAG TPA: DUF5681 domain-containing protein [Alteraurantiacibacter sp.]
MNHEDDQPEVQRDQKGRFRSSGNPRGRPYRIARDPKLPASRRNAIFRVADRKLPVNVEGKTENLTIFEANILRLGIAGAKGNRVAAKDFLQLTMMASNVDLQQRMTGRLLTDRMDRLEQENELLRQKYAPQKTGTLRVSMEEWERFQERRCDDGIADELREEERQARWDAEAKRNTDRQDPARDE